MALSTEWVALKTGQSGSGGVEYSINYHTLVCRNCYDFIVCCYDAAAGTAAKGC